MKTNSVSKAIRNFKKEIAEKLDLPVTKEDFVAVMETAYIQGIVDGRASVQELNKESVNNNYAEGM